MRDVTPPATAELTDWAPRKLTHQAARIEHLLYWSSKTPAERLAASRELTDRMYALQGIDRNESQADFTPSRVPRRKG